MNAVAVIPNADEVPHESLAHFATEMGLAY